MACRFEANGSNHEVVLANIAGTRRKNKFKSPFENLIFSEAHAIYMQEKYFWKIQYQDFSIYKLEPTKIYIHKYSEVADPILTGSNVNNIRP